MSLKVAFVHDYLNQYGGAEVALRHLHSLYPDAPVYTLIHDPDRLPSDFAQWDIRPVGWSKYLPLLSQMYRNYILLYPTMIEQINLMEYDLVISSSYLWAKGVNTKSSTLHLCYCYTPMRQAWELYFDYKHSYSRWIRKFIYPFVFNYLRMWDRLSADRVDDYIAISENVKRRIKKYYRRDAVVIYPPVESEKFEISQSVDDYYVCLSRIVPYKKIDLAVRAFNKLGKRLVVVGDGNQLPYLKRIAKRNIELVGFVDAKTKRELLSHAKALVFPADEDFGLVPVEAQLCGRPVIAFGSGGALESIVDGKTGLFFAEQTPEAIIDAVGRFEETGQNFDPELIRQNALRFDKSVFLQNMRDFIGNRLDEWNRQNSF